MSGPARGPPTTLDRAAAGRVDQEDQVDLDHVTRLGAFAPLSPPRAARAHLAALALYAACAAPALAKPPAPGERLFLPPVNVANAEVAKKVVVADFDGDKRADFAVLHWEIDGRGVFEGRDVHKGYLVRVYLNRTPCCPTSIWTRATTRACTRCTRTTWPWPTPTATASPT